MQPPHSAVPQDVLERALADTAEVALIERCSPSFDDMLAAFGEESLTRNADGSWSFAIAREYWPAERNARRWELFGEMMKARRERQHERSQRLAASEDRIAVVGPQGDRREIPAQLEDTIARKKGFHSGSFGRNIVLSYSADKTSARLR